MVNVLREKGVLRRGGLKGNVRNQNTVTEMKTAFAGLISRLDTAKGTVTDAKDVSKPTGKEKKK